MNHEIGSYQDKGVKVTMITSSEDRYLSHLYEQAVSRLMAGMSPNEDIAIAKLKEIHPVRLKAVTDNLLKNWTPEGIKEFESSMRRGMKHIGMWT